MKLPIAKLKTVKLQSLKPFKKIARRLSSLERTHTEQRAERSRNLARVKREKSAYRMAMTLLLVRPWVLVMGFWIFSMGIGTLALGGMLSPRRLTMALPEPTIDASVATTQSDNQSTDTLAGIPTTEAALSDAASLGADAGSTNSESAEPVQTSTASSLMLPLFLLVSSCAVGCFIISRRRTMKMAAVRARVRKAHGGSTASKSTLSSKTDFAIAQRSKPKAPVRKLSKNAVRRPVPKRANLKIFPQKVGQKAGQRVSQKSGSIASNLTGSLTAELQQKQRRPHPKSAIAARMAANRIEAKSAASGRKIVSRATTSGSKQARRVRTQTQKSTIRAAHRRGKPASQPTVVSVMPAGESHPLDWREGSLAHRMDVRPHRSAM